MTEAEQGGPIVNVKPELGVYKAITAAIKLLKQQGIGKDRKNQQQGYSFRGIDDVFNALAPVLSEVGLCILPVYSDRAVTERKTAQGGTLFTVILRGDFVFVAASDGSQHVVTTYGEAMDSGDKATNKAMSAAYKYAVIQTFSIPTEGDNDADSTTQPAVAWAEGKRAAGAVAENKITTLKKPLAEKAASNGTLPVIGDSQNVDEFLLALSVHLAHFPKIEKPQRTAQWALVNEKLRRLTGDNKEYESVLSGYVRKDAKGVPHASYFGVTPDELKAEMACFEEMWKVAWSIKDAQDANIPEYTG